MDMNGLMYKFSAPGLKEKKKVLGLGRLHSAYKHLHKVQSFSISQPIHLKSRPLRPKVSNIIQALKRQNI